MEYSIGAESNDSWPLSLPKDDVLDDDIEREVIDANDDSVDSIDYADICSKTIPRLERHNLHLMPR